MPPSILKSSPRSPPPLHSAPHPDKPPITAAELKYISRFWNDRGVDTAALCRFLGGPQFTTMNLAVRQYNVDAIEAANREFLALEAKHKKVGVAMPPYEFDELIGKGAFGRVFKA